MTLYESTCILGHKRTHRGPLAWWRRGRWWRRHEHPEVRITGTFHAYDQWAGHRAVHTKREV